MPSVRIRKLFLSSEDVHHEGGPQPGEPVRQSACAAVIENPFAGGYTEDLQSFMDELKPLGLEMSERLVDACGGAERVENYGKGSLIGVDGELEHGAMWHVPGGYAMRELLGEAKALVPSGSKVASAGATLDVPLGHINAAYVRSHFSALPVAVYDAPRPREIVFILCMCTGGRIHPRMGGLTVDGIKGEDGLR